MNVERASHISNSQTPVYLELLETMADQTQEQVYRTVLEIAGPIGEAKFQKMIGQYGVYSRIWHTPDNELVDEEEVGQKDLLRRSRIGAQTKAEQACLLDLIDLTDDVRQVARVIDMYDFWLGGKSHQEKGSFKSPASALPRTLAGWIKRNGQAISPEHPLVKYYAAVVQRAEDPAHPSSKNERLKRRLSSLRVLSHQQVRSDADKRDGQTFIRAMQLSSESSLADDPMRRKIKALTNRWVVDFDVDGENLEEFMTKVERTMTKSSGQTQLLLDAQAPTIVTDTLVLLASLGSGNAEKLLSALNGRREKLRYDTAAGTIPVTSFITVANEVTKLINNEQVLLDGEGQPKTLDALPNGRIAYLPEAFRRLLYTCLDLDSTVTGKVDDLVEGIDITRRVEALMDYVDAREGNAPTREIGILAMAGMRGVGFTRASGKPVYRAGIYTPGFGQFS